jgi:hypothetical protein
MATVTGARLGLSFNKDSESNVSLQGTGLVKHKVVTIRYPATGTPTYEWTGEIHKKSKSEKSAEAKVKQNKAVLAKDRPKDLTGNVSITVDSSTVTAEADIYEE